jgi:hypothetical protein
LNIIGHELWFDPQLVDLLPVEAADQFSTEWVVLLATGVKDGQATHLSVYQIMFFDCWLL